MINQRNNILQVLFNTTDLTKQANRVENSNFTLTTTTSDYIYLGYKKQLWQFYFDIQTANTNNSNIAVEKYNGTTWEEIDVLDETDGFKRSGFIFVEKNHDTQTYNDYKFLRIKVSADTSAVVFRHIGLVFCNLEDLKMEEPSIERFYPRDFNSHIQSQMSAINYIMRNINLSGLKKYYDLEVSNLVKFDLFDINEVREAGTYYTLYKIYSNRADSGEDDAYRLKAKEYLEKFQASFAVFSDTKLTYDINDDGTEDQVEKDDSIRSASFIR